MEIGEEKDMKIFLGLFAIVLTIGACTGQQPTSQQAKEQPSSVSATTAVENKGPVPFSEVKKDIMTAKDTWDFFSFKDGKGTCLDQGFPINMIYTSANVMKTGDDAYIEDLTMVDFTGRIRFDGVKLTTGNAACEMKTITGEDAANLSCKVNDKEVCAATFKVFANKK